MTLKDKESKWNFDFGSVNASWFNYLSYWDITLLYFKRLIEFHSSRRSFSYKSGNNYLRGYGESFFNMWGSRNHKREKLNKKSIRPVVLLFLQLRCYKTYKINDQRRRGFCSLKTGHKFPNASQPNENLPLWVQEV